MILPPATSSRLRDLIVSVWKRRPTRVARLVMVLLTSIPMIARETRRLDDGWMFHRGDIADAQAPAFDMTASTAVTLPHDWSIALPVDPAAPAAGHGGYFPGGIGWYRRVIAAPKSWAGRQVTIEFEGAYMNTQVWLNGVLLGRHPYGYTPFSFDLTPHLRLGADNVLAVRVDNSAQPNARWYTGSGLIRPVRLRITDSVHVVDGDLFVATTALTERSARVRVESTVRNETGAACAVVLETEIRDPSNRKVAAVSAERTLAAGDEWATTPELGIPEPKAWSPDSPNLYRAVIRVRSAGRTIDEVSTPFGVRTVRVSAAHGFELNGRTLKLLGGSVHDDTGVLGAAAFDAAEERKVSLLKAAGFNAVRTAHNPPAPAFLAACDRQGLLVMDEIFDGWAKPKTPHDYSVWFQDWWRRDVDAWVRRDRNHPSVVMWSAGNEMYERGTADGRRIAREIVARIRASDPTRLVTAGINGLGKTRHWTELDPLFAAFDVAGYNYELDRYAVDHGRRPERVIMATESYQSEAFANWAIVQDNAYVIGDFVWSAMDYLGEAGIGRVFPPEQPVIKHWEGNHFPWHGAYCGDIDLIGWRKPSSHYRSVIDGTGEKLYMAVITPTPDGKPWNLSPWSMPPAEPSWTWPGHEGIPLTVEIYSRYDAVRLSLNGKVIGEQPTSRKQAFKATFTVPYAAGVVQATGLRDGRAVETFVLKTAGQPAVLRLTVDRAKIEAGGADLAFVTVEVLDRTGIPVPSATPLVRYEINGPGAIAGIGSGDLTTTESYQANPRHLFQGRGLVVIRSGKTAGPIKLTATAAGLPRAEITVATFMPR